MILVLGGTKDARELARFLADNNFKVMLTVTTPLAESLAPKNVFVYVAKLTEETFIELITAEKVTAVIDATHPFAEQISRLAFLQASQHGLPYFRLERAEIDYPDGTVFAKEFTAAARLVAQDLADGDKIFAAIGVRHLQQFLQSGNFLPKDIYVRVLPSSVEECVKLGFPKENIFTGQGPFSYQDNYQHFSKTQAKWLITKASGLLGGEKEKLAAALDLGIKIVVVKRPEKMGNKYYSYQEILDDLRRMT